MLRYVLFPAQEMRQSVQEFAKDLLDHTRTSNELEIMLNFAADATVDAWEPGFRQTLERLKLAINYKQKQFVAHPSVQQLLASIWYEGMHAAHMWRQTFCGKRSYDIVGK